MVVLTGNKGFCFGGGVLVGVVCAGVVFGGGGAVCVAGVVVEGVETGRAVVEDVVVVDVVVDIGLAVLFAGAVVVLGAFVDVGPGLFVVEGFEVVVFCF